MDDERTDNMLMMIARQHTGGVDALLDTFFGFLRRRTDFFTGAEPAVIEKTVLDAARRQRGIADREKAKREAEAERKREEARSKVKPATATSTTAAAAAAVLSDSEVVEVSSDGSFDAAAMTAPTVAASSSAAAAAAAAPPSRTAETAAASVSASTEAPVAAAAAASSSSSVAASTPSDDAPAGDDGDAEDSDSAGKLRPNRGNGADQDRYSWSQTLKEVTIVMPMPKGIKSKQLAIDITATTIQCGVAGQPPVLRGKLCKPILTEETSWTLGACTGPASALDKLCSLTETLCVCVIGDR